MEKKKKKEKKKRFWFRPETFLENAAVKDEACTVDVITPQCPLLKQQEHCWLYVALLWFIDLVTLKS